MPGSDFLFLTHSPTRYSTQKDAVAVIGKASVASLELQIVSKLHWVTDRWADLVVKVYMLNFLKAVAGKSKE